MGQIIKSLASVCHSVSLPVCKHSYGRNFDSILIKFCTMIWNPKSKIEFVWDKKSDNSFPYFTPIKKLLYSLWRFNAVQIGPRKR